MLYKCCYLLIILCSLEERVDWEEERQQLHSDITQLHSRLTQQRYVLALTQSNSALLTYKADDLYRGSMQSEDHRRTALQYPLVHWTLCRCEQYDAFSTKALARYQVILLGEQRHIRCEQLAQV